MIDLSQVTAEDWERLVIGGGVLFTAVGTFINNIRVRRNTQSIAELHVIINSRMDALLASTALAARAQGVKDEQNRKADSTQPGV